MQCIVNTDLHTKFLHAALMQLLPIESAALRLHTYIGSDLSALLDEYDNPVEVLFLWLAEKFGPLAKFVTDDEDYCNFAIPESILLFCIEIESISASEQLAAYGIWLISENNMESYGPLKDCDDRGYNFQGNSKEDIISHRAESMLLAYQALSYAERMIMGGKLSDEEKKKSKEYDFSAIGAAGAAKRHAPTNTLKAWALDLYRAGKWLSANQAAYELKDRIIEHGRTIGVNFQSKNAQRTIAEWFRKSVWRLDGHVK